MFPGSKHQGLELAKLRWSQLNNFDLEETEWRRLFDLYGVGIVLESIKSMRRLSDPRPEARYRLFVDSIERTFAHYHR